MAGGGGTGEVGGRGGGGGTGGGGGGGGRSTVGRPGIVVLGIGFPGGVVRMVVGRVEFSGAGVVVTDGGICGEEDHHP